MSRRTLLGVALAAAAAGVVLLVWPKETRTPEDQVRAVIAAMVEAAERRSAADVVEHLSDDFVGQGGARKAEVKQLLIGQFFQARSMGVANPRLEVTIISPSQARFSGTFYVAREAEALQGDKFEIDGELEQRDGAWRVLSATWAR